MTYDTDETSLFILRRAWLFQRCRRKDVDTIFGTRNAPARASRIMQQAIIKYPKYLQWTKKFGILPLGNQKPHEVEALTIMNLIALGKSSIETGIFQGESLPFLMPQPLRTITANEKCANDILQAVLNDKPLEILYVGLRKGENARWRKVWPSGLEFTGIQWRLHAQDIEDPQGVIKVYVMGRILETRYLTTVVKNFKRRKVISDRVNLRAQLNTELTPDQQHVLQQSFGMDKNCHMSWPAYALYEFKRDFVEAPVSLETVWPVISRLDVLD